MRDRWGETSAFKEGLSIVRRLVAEGARRPGTQQCTLLLLSHPDRPLFLKHDVNNAFAVELENIFEHLECSHQTPRPGKRASTRPASCSRRIRGRSGICT